MSTMSKNPDLFSGLSDQSDFQIMFVKLNIDQSTIDISPSNDSKLSSKVL